MFLRIWLTVYWLWILPWHLKADISDEFLVGELYDQEEYNEFRPQTAREVMKHAARVAEKQRSAENTYAIVQGAGMGPRGMRVAVHGVMEVTTSRYNFQRPRRFRKVAAWPESPQFPQEEDRLVSSYRNPYAAQDFTRKPIHFTQERKVEQKPQRKFNGHDKRKPWTRDGREPRRDFRNLKRKRDKRQVHGGYDSGAFELPPMSNEWTIKKKKKKKKKKQTTTDMPTTKKMQKHSKKVRIYMESSEMKLGKGKGINIVKDMSKELDNLLAGAEDIEEDTLLPPQQTVPPTSKAKYVPIPKNWQNPPSWRPPTRSPHGGLSPAGRWKFLNADVVTVPRHQPSAKVVEAVTEFDWKSYNHPLKVVGSETTENLVLKPAPVDWPAPTHPADGIYDWHKAQIRRAPRTFQPFPTPSLSDNSYKRNYDERVSLQNNDMWQTRPWVSLVHPTLAITWPTIGTKSLYFDRSIYEDHTELDISQLYFRHSKEGSQRADRAGYKRRGPPSDQTHLTPRTDALGEKLNNFQADRTERQSQFGGNNQQYKSWHRSWQGILRQSKGESFQNKNSFNFTTYYNHQSRQFYSRSDNKSRGIFHKIDQFDNGRRYGSYNKYNFNQYQAKIKSRIKPPSYFYSALAEQKTSNDSIRSQAMSSLEPPFRLPDEYAGNDRNLCEPIPTYFSKYPVPTISGWTPARFKPVGRHRYTTRGWRIMGARPTGYRSLFTVPLKRGTPFYATRSP